jgi:FkbM family methyltransferase
VIKSILIRVPPVYEAVQAFRDRRFHRQGTRLGTYAQHGEDIKLLKLLRDAGATGAYLDVGCNHPFRLSNSYLLYLNGWRGLCIDPLPRFSRAFKRWRPDDMFECAAVGEMDGDLPLFEFESDVLSTLDANLADAYLERGYRLRRKSTVKIRSINSILQAHRITAPLSLLSLDIEGYELPALRSIDLDQWRPMFICMEVLTADGHRNEAAIEYLMANGYRPAADMGLNIVFRRLADARSHNEN